MTLKRHPAELAAASIALGCVLFAPTNASIARSQESILGQHTLNLRLKPTPVSEVLKLLSGRSKAVAKLPDGVRPEDEGQPWEVDGADQLDGVVVAVNFVETPVEQLVGQLLGCVGFDYVERGERIEVVKSAQGLTPDQCTSVTRVEPASVADHRALSAPAKTYSYHSEGVDALQFIRDFSDRSKQNIAIPYHDGELLKDIRFRVSIKEAPTENVLQMMLGCIGWKTEKTSAGYLVVKSDEPPRGQCEGFTRL